MKTVVMEILEDLLKSGIKYTPNKEKEFLEKEKQQIIEAYIEGHITMKGASCSETYYEETFEKK